MHSILSCASCLRSTNLLVFCIVLLSTATQSKTTNMPPISAQPTTTTTATMNKPKIAMHWFRKGLRLHDNPALLHGLRNAVELYPVYVLDGDCYQLLKCTALRANFLVECLQDLDAGLRSRGSRLYVVHGDPTVVLPRLWRDWNITHVTYEQDETGEPYAKERDEAIHTIARDRNIEVKAFGQETLYPLASYFSKSGNSNNNTLCNTMSAFQTLFAKMPPLPQPEDAPTVFPKTAHSIGDGRGDDPYAPPRRATDLPWPRSIPREQVAPLWGPGDCRTLTPIVRGGETQALRILQEKMQHAAWVATFEKPNTSCTSGKPSTTSLSPYMSLGCLSPRTFWFAIRDAIDRSSKVPSKPPVSLHGQLLWRDFNNFMAAAANRNSPGSWGQIVNNRYCREISWDDDPELLELWKNGQTGYPWIDACMMQLKQEGWIHHLGRHAVACFLTRGDLWQSWEKGAEHFESHLLDADYALNGFNWLWLSCSGFFYQYFRCYSPVAFQKKNDPTGQYIRKYLPVLARLPDKYIYEPWKAPAAVQNTARVIIGKDYPKPLVDHATVSKENMEKLAYAYEQHKSKESGGSETKKKNKSDPGKTKQVGIIKPVEPKKTKKSSSDNEPKKRMKQLKLK